jgi:nicotinamide-nucleotide amidase
MNKVNAPEKPVSLKFFNEASAAGITCAFAESITAGNLSAELVNYPGASSVLAGGVTSYSNDVKTGLLGVSPDTLDKYGAVSDETAREMLQGLSGIIKADIYAAVSGIAGPGGGSAEKPVGTVYIGILYNGKMTVEKLFFKGSRTSIINQTVEHVYASMLHRIGE